MKTVLILGSGRVSGPVVEYLSNDYKVKIASNLKAEADDLVRNVTNAESQYLDVSQDEKTLTNLVQKSDLVISLLPLTFQVRVAHVCITCRKSLVTASYASPEMKTLHQQAVDADVTLMNEVGLDPGIDHMLAMRTFDQVKQEGGTVVGYTSYCGGIPAPETDMTSNPLRYKFSWSPVTALTSTMRPARYLRDEEIVEVPAGGHLLDHVTEMSILPGVVMEGVPNGDSLFYRELFHAESTNTFQRGSLRYKGYVNTMQGLVKLGLIDDTPHPALHPGGPDLTWKELLCHLTKNPADTSVHTLRDCIYHALDQDKRKLEAVEQLGLLDDVLVEKMNTPVDTLAAHLDKRLAYGPGERDLVILRNLTEIQWPSHRETRDDQMVMYGDADGYSAMAKCVGYTTAIAAKMILEGDLQVRGLVMPTGAAIYRPLLERLEELGIASVRIDGHSR